MIRLSMQFFAHKKGVGSTKNGRDSESKRLGVKRADGQLCIWPATSWFASAALTSIRERMLAVVLTIRCLP